MIRRPPRSTQSRSSAASDVYKRQTLELTTSKPEEKEEPIPKKAKPTPEASTVVLCSRCKVECGIPVSLSLIHISEPTRLGMISYAVFCLTKKKKKSINHNTL